MRENLRQFDRSARQLADAIPDGDVAGGLVDLKTSATAAEAGTKAIRALDEATGDLLDLLA